MHSKIVFLAFCLGISICNAQKINISGTVKDHASIYGIPEATVRLVNADLSTTTRADGSFFLNEISSMQRTFHSFSKGIFPIYFSKGKLVISLFENTVVSLTIFDVKGVLLYKINRTFSAGTHILSYPIKNLNLMIYKVAINDKTFSFKLLPLGTFMQKSNISPGFANVGVLDKKGTSTDTVRNILQVTKQGQLDYQESLSTYDTSGILINMIPSAGNISDIDGNVYQTVQIGNQIWTVENLRTTRYNDGTEIPYITENSIWKHLSTPGYCWYGNSNDFKEREKWGALYNWYVINTGKLAPVGWHVPTDAEWDTLQNYLSANGYNWDGTKTYNKIAKALAAKTDWVTNSIDTGTIGCNIAVNNSSGFSALPGSFRFVLGNFGYRNYIGDWWSTTEYDEGDAHHRHLCYNSYDLSKSSTYKGEGRSVRLLRD